MKVPKSNGEIRRRGAVNDETKHFVMCCPLNYNTKNSCFTELK